MKRIIIIFLILHLLTSEASLIFAKPIAEVVMQNVVKQQWESFKSSIWPWGDDDE